MADTILEFRIPEAKVADILALLERNFDRLEGEADKAFAERYFIDHLKNLKYRDDGRRARATVVMDDDLIEEEP